MRDRSYPPPPPGSLRRQSARADVTITGMKVALFSALAVIVMGYGSYRILKSTPPVNPDSAVTNTVFQQTARDVLNPAEARGPIVRPKDEPRWMKAVLGIRDKRDWYHRHYAKEAVASFRVAHQKGVIARAQKVSKTTKAPACDILALAHCESTMDEKKQDLTTAKGIVQITDGTFLEGVGRYGAADLALITEDNPAIGQAFAYLLQFVSFKEGKTILDNDAYCADQLAINPKFKKTDKALRDRILKLREGKDGHLVSLLFAYRDIQRKLPLLRAYMEERNTDFADQVERVFGTMFLGRMIHNWGLEGAKKILTSDPSAQLGAIVGDKEAGQNGWDPKDSTGFVMVKTAIICSVLSKQMQNCLEDPEPYLKPPATQMAQSPTAPSRQNVPAATAAAPPKTGKDVKTAAAQVTKPPAQAAGKPPSAGLPSPAAPKGVPAKPAASMKVAAK